MYTVDFNALNVLMLLIVFIFLILMYLISNNNGNNNEIYLSFLPGSKHIDIKRLDKTRSERGIPMTEGII